ncbi:uncharacterized protein LOC106459011 isoform X2 [Limulus polyphemus]|nr:uncharacterized protein LOC106459011 isoform X2 [Limulus polyphemus]
MPIEPDNNDLEMSTNLEEPSGENEDFDTEDEQNKSMSLPSNKKRKSEYKDEETKNSKSGVEGDQLSDTTHKVARRKYKEKDDKRRDAFETAVAEQSSGKKKTKRKMVGSESETDTEKDSVEQNMPALTVKITSVEKSVAEQENNAKEEGRTENYKRKTVFEATNSTQPEEKSKVLDQRRKKDEESWAKHMNENDEKQSHKEEQNEDALSTNKTVSKQDDRTHKKKISKKCSKLYEIDDAIKFSLSYTNLNIEGCLRAMNELKNLPLSQTILAKEPDIVQTVRKCCKFKNSVAVQEKAQQIYQKIKEYFSVEEGEHFNLVFESEVKKHQAWTESENSTMLNSSRTEMQRRLKSAVRQSSDVHAENDEPGTSDKESIIANEEDKKITF